MASITAPRPGRSLIGKASATIAARKARAGRQPSRVAAAVAVAREHVVTVAALASVDLGAFHWGAGVGWITLGVSLLVFDFAARG